MKECRAGRARGGCRCRFGRTGFGGLRGCESVGGSSGGMGVGCLLSYSHAGMHHGQVGRGEW